MALTRRRFVATAAAATALAPMRVWSAVTLTMGNMQIDTLYDGYLSVPGSFALGDIPVADAAPILERYGLGTDRIDRPCNVTLLRDGANTVLFDVGSGPDFVPTAGTMLDALDALGVVPEDITHVVFTHAHLDHIGGILDDFDDPMFYNASHMIGRTEFDYWNNPDTVNTIATSRTTMAAGAKRRLDILGDSVTTFGNGDEILPGVAAVVTPGHTPGHMSFELRRGSTSALITGDAVVNHHLAFEHPAWPAGADQDQQTGIRSRLRLLDRLATEQITTVGFHLPQGGIGRTEKSGDGYRFVAYEA
ncbi:MAG: MBL fold metallo-hydrolase [Rhodobacteraceae bacterium]|nr:MBL fold metallo-hydrolase [Paracoccaceae bacterium]